MKTRNTIIGQRLSFSNHCVSLLVLLVLIRLTCPGQKKFILTLPSGYDLHCEPSMVTKYVCLPEYECCCYPRGKAVSRSTMLRHRRKANSHLIDDGKPGNLPWGLPERNSGSIRAHYEALLELSRGQSLARESESEEHRCRKEVVGNSARHSEDVGLRAEHISSHADPSQLSNRDDVPNCSETEKGVPTKTLCLGQVPAFKEEPIHVLSVTPHSFQYQEGSTDNCSSLRYTPREEVHDSDRGSSHQDRDGSDPMITLAASNDMHMEFHFSRGTHEYGPDWVNGTSVSQSRSSLIEHHSQIKGRPRVESSVPTEATVSCEVASNTGIYAGSEIQTQASAYDQEGSFGVDYDFLDDYKDEVENQEKETVFTLWLKENKPRIDLYCKHNISQVVMDDILHNIKSPYKCWKTIVSPMCHESAIESSLLKIPICSGHMCFYKDEVTHCSVCGIERTQEGNSSESFISWLTLRNRIASILLNETLCRRMYEYFRSSLCNSSKATCDFFHSQSFKRVASRYGGLKSVKNDIFLTLSTDGFQAFQKQTHTIWPIAAIICNLHPSERFLVRNVIPFTFIPGPTEPQDLQSFLGPLVEEVKQIEYQGFGTEFLFYDGTRKRVRVHILWFTGDLTAVKKISGLKGHNGIAPCRYCTLTGVWSVPHRHYYFPSYVTHSEGIFHVFDPARLNLRTEHQSYNTIRQLLTLTGVQKAALQTKTGIGEGSILFSLPSIAPYQSFPIDIMHLFYNIGKDFIRAWTTTSDERYTLRKASVRAIDSELMEFGSGIPSPLGSRPITLSRFAEWKSAELKDFTLSYSIVVLDGHMSEDLLSSWKNFVEIVDICWRPQLTDVDIERLRMLCITFYTQFEKDYYMGDPSRVNMCKYTFHLLLHLADGVVECGPPINYSQYWMERYIGWVKGRMNAWRLASSSLFNDCKFVEAYKHLFSNENGSENSHTGPDGHHLCGQRCSYLVGTDSDLDDLLSSGLKNYLMRKYEGLTSEEAFEILEGEVQVTFRSCVSFCCRETVQKASARFKPGTLREISSRMRQNWHVACEMDSDGVTEVYYGRILMLFEYELDLDLSQRWDHWQKKYEVGLLDWISGLKVNHQEQVFKRGRATDAFSSKTIEDVSIVTRLISVVDHLVPSRNTGCRGRRQCYFLDNRNMTDRLARNTKETARSGDKFQCGMRRTNHSNT